MFKINKIIFVIVAVLVFSAVEVFACSCISVGDESPADAVKRATKDSIAVFAGKVVGFEYRKDIPNEYIDFLEERAGKHLDYETKIAKFKIEKRWKGKLASETFLTTSEIKLSDGTISSSGCNYVFRLGESYLIYAYGTQDDLRTDICTRTKVLSETEDISILGAGNR